MSWQQALCGAIGHSWTRHVEHIEPGTPRLVRCRRCGFVSSLEAERRKLADTQGGRAHVDP